MLMFSHSSCFPAIIHSGSASLTSVNHRYAIQPINKTDRCESVSLRKRILPEPTGLCLAQEGREEQKQKQKDGSNRTCAHDVASFFMYTAYLKILQQLASTSTPHGMKSTEHKQESGHASRSCPRDPRWRSSMSLPAYRSGARESLSGAVVSCPRAVIRLIASFF